MQELEADWHDREICFDVTLDSLELRRGEFIIDSLEPVEDTKGNNGESGVLQVTNLRMIWMSTHNVKTNLSIGYSAVVNIHIRAANSRLKTQFENQDKAARAYAANKISGLIASSAAQFADVNAKMDEVLGCTHTQRQSIAYCSRAKENKCHHRTRQKYQISFSYRAKRIFESLTFVDGGTGGGSPELPGDLSNAAA